MGEISVKLIKHPTEEDWMFCKRCTLNTVGLKPKGAPDEKWKKDLIRCEHSPIRTLWFGFELYIPYYCSTHIVRHKIGCEHFVQSQRDDRQKTVDVPRAEKGQGEFVSHILYINAQELMFFMRKRLCSQADATTQKIARLMRDEVYKSNPEFVGELVPACEYQHECREMFPCPKAKFYNQNLVEDYFTNIGYYTHDVENIETKKDSITGMPYIEVNGKKIFEVLPASESSRGLRTALSICDETVTEDEKDYIIRPHIRGQMDVIQIKQKKD